MTNPPSGPGPSAEDRLIAGHFAGWAGEGAFALKDDCAVWRVAAGDDLVVTTDAIVAGVHFLPDDPPEDIAVKALGVNLSDLAAKGARPAAFLLTLVLPRTIGDDWLGRFAGSLRATAEAASCVLLGGDTTSTPGPLTISITAFGDLPKDRAVTRLGAKTGDTIAVSGTIGDAAIGLSVVTKPERFAGLAPGHREHLARRYRRPEPRLQLATVVRDHAHAAMDVSDGLIGDVAKLLRASGLGGELHLDAVPLSDAARAAITADPALRDRALTGGDDYEIVMTVAPDRFAALQQAADAAGIPATAIGTVRPEPGLVCLEADGTVRDFTAASYSHF